MVAGLARAFETGRFVQCDIDMLAVCPRLAEDCEFKVAGLDGGAAVPNDIAGDAHFPAGNQFAAPLARAKALRLQDTIQS